MKRAKLLLFLTVMAGCALTVTSCKDDNNNESSWTHEGENSHEVNPNANWKKCTRPTFISGIDNEDADLQAVINSRFTNQVNDIDQAEIAFVDAASEYANSDKTDQLLERGGIVVFMRPGKADPNEQKEYLDISNDNPQFTELLVAETGFGFHYTLFDEDDFSGNYVYDESRAMNAEELAAVQADEAKQQVPATYKNIYDYDNESERNENYYNIQMTSFIDWLETTFALRDEQKASTNAPAMAQRRAGNDDYNLSSLKKNLNFDGQIYQFDVPISLNKAITKYNPSGTWDYLNKSSVVSVKYHIYPTHAGKCNGDDFAGDYYVVTGSVTPKNDAMWGAYQGSHFWSADRIFGYWFKSMEVTADLLNEKNDNIVDGLRFYTAPIPENKVNAMTYSNGFSWGMNFSVTGGYKWGGPNAGADVHGTAGFSFQCTSSENYTLNNIEFARQNDDKTVKYTYWTNNVKLTDHGGTEPEKLDDENFPTNCRTEFVARNAWIWYIPNGKGGVDDNSTTRHRFRVKLKVTYSSWYHWRGAKQYDSNRADYEIEDKEPRIKTLEIPNRTTWGIIALKNAANNTMCNIRYYNQKGEKVDSVINSWNVNEVAKRVLPEGTYTVTFETRNANQGNKLLGRWKYENVKVKQGKTEQASTTEISTVNAVKD